MITIENLRVNTIPVKLGRIGEIFREFGCAASKLLVTKKESTSMFRSWRFTLGWLAAVASALILPLSQGQGEEPKGKAPEGMVWIASGSFWMGSENGPEDEQPLHKVALDGFWMD